VKFDHNRGNAADEQYLENKPITIEERIQNKLEEYGINIEESGIINADNVN